jgi:AraC-like DNA-binding protein
MKTIPATPLTSSLAGEASEGPNGQFLETPETLLALAAEPALARIREDQKRASDRLRPLLHYMEEHLFDPTLNVNQVKLACKVRDNSIVILFHAEVGQPPKTYLTNLRLGTAAILLRDTELKIWRISDMVGYSAIGVFSKAFQRWSGLRPQYYRAESRIRQWENQPPIEVLDSPLLEQALRGDLGRADARRLIGRLCALYEVSREEMARAAW